MVQSTASGPPRPLISDAVLLALLALSLSGNVFLGLRLHRINIGPDRQRPTPLTVGTVLPPLSVHTVAGQVAKINFDSATRPTVLFAFAAGCPWCKRTWPLVKHLSEIRGEKYRFVGLCVSQECDGFIAPFEMYTHPSAEALQALHLIGVPHTYVISSSGRVEQSWPGAFTGLVSQEVSRFFGVALSDVSVERP